MGDYESLGETETRLESVLAAVGIGRWQAPLLLSAVLIQICVPVQKMGSTFFNAPMAFHCSLPNDTSPVLNISDYDNVCLRSTEQRDNGTWLDNSQTGLATCPVVQYDTSTFELTITSQYHLICERDPLRPLFQVMYTGGNMAGTFGAGHLSDRFGRRTAVWVGSILALPTGLMMALVPSFTSVLVMNFLMGVANTLTFVPIYSLMMECCPPNKRVLISMSTSVPYAAAITALGGMSYLMRDWRYLLLLCTIPSALLLLFIWVMSESPRWLVQTGRGSEAAYLLRRAAELNQAPPSPSLTLLYTHYQEGLWTVNDEETKESGFFHDMKECLCSLVMRSILLCSICSNFTINMILLGILLNGHNFTSDYPREYVMGLGACHLAALLLSLVASQVVGRKVVVVGASLLISFLLLVNILLPQEIQWLKWALVLIAYFFVAFAEQITLVYYVELMPTVVRSRGVTMVEMFGFAGELCVPFVTDILSQHVWWGADAVYIAAGVLSALSVLPLPETKDQPLPDTIRDVEIRQRSIGPQWNILNFRCFHKDMER